MRKNTMMRLVACAILSIVVCVCTAYAFVNAAEQTVYLDPVVGSDSNTGKIDSPYKTLSKAISSAGSSDTRIVVMNDLEITGDFTEPSHTGKVTITSGTYSSAIIFPSALTVYRMNGATTFDSVNIKLSNYVIFAAQFNPIVFGNKVNIENGSKYAFVVGGYETPTAGLAADLDSSITINGGDFYKICGFTRTKGAATYTFTGTSDITVNGGSVVDVYGASLYNHYSGNACITVNGGSVSNVYAAGDVTRRLNGDATVSLNGGVVGTLNVNNVVGNAVVNLNGICPQTVSVSYASDTIKTLAEKAGSTKTVNYNAVFCPSDVVSTFDNNFDVINNVTVVYTGEGDGDGSSAQQAMSSFADAYEKIAQYGGTLYVVGTAECDRIIAGGSYCEPVVIKGHTDDAVISMPDGYSLYTYTKTTFEGMCLFSEGKSTIDCRFGDITIGNGVSCNGKVSINATAPSADVTCNIASGSFYSVIGSTSTSAQKVSINISGGSIDVLTGAYNSASNVRIEMCAGGVGEIYVANGEISGEYTVKLAGGKIGKYTAARSTGKSILSISGADVSEFDLSALSSSGESVLVLGRGADRDEFASVLDSFDIIKEENALYVADGGTGDGLSALSPMGDLNAAIKALGSEGKIVVTGDVSVVNHLGIKAHSYPVTITSKDEDADYTGCAAIDMNGNIVIGGETTFENICFTCPKANAFIYGNECKLTIGDGVDTVLTQANTNYINISGGRVDNYGNGDGCITVNSGNWGKFRGGSVKTATVTTTRSTIDLTVNGGTFHGYFICGSRGNVYGDVTLTVNGGTFMQGIFGVYEEDTAVYDRYFNYDIVYDIRAGEFHAEIAPARDKQTELHGTYTVYLHAGEFHSLTDLCGSEEYAGDMTSTLYVEPRLDTEASVVKELTFTNYLRRNNADPWLFYHNGNYYYTCTGATTISLIKTANIGDIKTASSKVILRPTSGVNMWSPEIHYFTEEEAGVGNAGWYIFVGHDDGTTSNQRQYVAKCLDGDNLMGRWGDPVTGEVNVLRKVTFPDSPENNETQFTGGMSVLKANGKSYITYVSELGRDTADFHQTLNICEFENPWTMKGTPTVICEPEYDWEAGGSGYSETLGTWYPKVVEGASAVYSDDGDVYLMYTGSGYWTVYYQLGYMKLTGDDPLVRSSWTKNPEPIFSLSDEINGCGHASYFKDHNGDYWACYHAYIGKDTSSKRFSFVERIYVTGDGVSIGNGTGHPAPLDTVYTVSANPTALEQKIHGFGNVADMDNADRLSQSISTPAQLIELMNNSQLWGGVYKLGADIDLSTYTGDLHQMPIGNAEVAFTGEFAGCGYAIRGVNIEAPVSTGLFGRVGGGALIKDLTVYGTVKNTSDATSAEYFDDKGNYITTGGVVGIMLGGSLENVCSYVTVNGNGNCGGVVGMIYITDNSTAALKACVNWGIVNNTYGNTGGVVGRIQLVGKASDTLSLLGCENYADVVSTSFDRCRVGGIVGYIRTETCKVIIEKCINHGDVSGQNTQTATNNIAHVGGIVGRTEITDSARASLIIRDSKNEGDITTTVRGGGIAGIITRSATCTAESGIYRCENRGEIIGSYKASTVQIGGITGYIDNNYDALNFLVSDCANYAVVGCIGGKCYAGGIIGGQDSVDLVRCVNYGNVTGHSSGFAGALTGVEVNDGVYKVENCYALSGTCAKLYGYSRSAYCTETNNVFVSSDDISKTLSYPSLDFQQVWVMREEGAVLLVHAPALRGDADGDAWLTNSDITLLVRYLGGWTVELDISMCDMDLNGLINNRDAIAIIRKLSLLD